VTTDKLRGKSVEVNPGTNYCFYFSNTSSTNPNSAKFQRDQPNGAPNGSGVGSNGDVRPIS